MKIVVVAVKMIVVAVKMIVVVVKVVVAKIVSIDSWLDVVTLLSFRWIYELFSAENSYLIVIRYNFDIIW